MITHTLLQLRARFRAETGLEPNRALVNADDYEELARLVIGQGRLQLAGMVVVEVDEQTTPFVGYVIQ